MLSVQNLPPTQAEVWQLTRQTLIRLALGSARLRRVQASRRPM